MIRAIVRRSMADDGWIVEVDHVDDIIARLPVRTRARGGLASEWAHTHAEAMLLAHQLLLSHDRS